MRLQWGRSEGEVIRQQLHQSQQQPSAMTAEDRNRRAKWGHDMPRSWISDFNMTHPTGRPHEPEQELIERVRAKARRQRFEDRAAQRAAAQRSIEQTLVAGAACLGLLVGGVVALATWQQLMPPASTPQLQR
jgi:chemotaxis response regulator CheB